MLDKGVQTVRFQAMEEIAERYSHHACFYGWYFPNEAMLQPYFVDACVNYVNETAAFAQRLTPNCVNLIAPYFIKEARFDDHFVRQLEKMNIDIIAYQDGVGVNHTSLEDSAKFYEILYKAHEKLAGLVCGQMSNCFILRMEPVVICFLLILANALSGSWKLCPLMWIRCSAINIWAL